MRQTPREFSVQGILQGANPAVSIMVAALLIILGILVILYPPILQWVVGIGLILAGVGGVAVVLIPTR